VQSVILGDRPTAEAMRALEECLVPVPAVAEPRPEVDTLRALGMHVIELVIDYLQTLAAEWEAHVEQLHTTVRTHANKLTRECKHADRVLRRYSSPVVQREHRAEMLRLRAELDTLLNTLRSRSPPVVARPDALVSATNELRAAYADAYGTVPTPTLLASKRCFESAMCEAQRAISERFVKHVTKYI
jgi:hypothetical protein